MINNNAGQMVSQLFWFVATVQIALAIAFAVLVRKAPTPHGSALQIRLAHSQRKDDWLACGVIWLGICSDDFPMAQLILVLGCVALAWLAHRTSGRLRVLQR
jgi:hypothetical protein